MNLSDCARLLYVPFSYFTYSLCRVLVVIAKQEIVSDIMPFYCRVVDMILSI